MLEHSVCETAYAKINLHLQVGDKRTDGFHNIESIFQSISLADVLQVRLTKNFSIRCLNFALSSENSLKKAYEVFCKVTGFNEGVEVLLLKQIPACAGLGGASTDAVALLKALNQLSEMVLSTQQLEAMALQIGSDCPFFISSGTAYVSGRGDIIEPLISKKAMGVLVYPQIESKTDKAYAMLDAKRAKKLSQNETDSTETKLEGKKALLTEYARLKNSWKGVAFRNDFESVIFSSSPAVKEAKQALQEAGADFSLMTGSGSAVFGLFSDVKVLNRAVKTLKLRFDFCEPFLFC